MIRFLLVLFLIISCQEKKETVLELSFNNKTISKQQLREDYNFLEDNDFKLKFNSSLESPLDFFRSYPITYFKETKLTGDYLTSTCLGDPHFDNFGFLLFEQGTRYVFNDLDDSGLCPLPLDALRYFTSLYFFSFSHDHIEKFISDYVSLLSEDQEVPEIPDSLVEDLEEKRLKNLEKYTEQNKFKTDSDFLPLSLEMSEQIKSALTSKFNAITVHDSVYYTKEDGGSGGLKRYWVLISDQDKFDILELKERAVPATTFSTNNPNTPELLELAQTIWGSQPVYFEELKLEVTSFLVRSRSKDDINLSKIDPELRQRVISVQIALMANFHKKVSLKEQSVSADWYIKSSKAIAQRYLQAFEQLKN